MNRSVAARRQTAAIFGWAGRLRRFAETPPRRNGYHGKSRERKTEKEEKGRRFHRVERFYGRFARSFAIPDDAEADDMKAEFKDGVLRVHLAKSEKARPKQIEVKVS